MFPNPQHRPAVARFHFEYMDLPQSTPGFVPRKGDIESYQHKDHHGWLHIDPAGSFYDRLGLPIARETALENAGHVAQSLDNAQSRPVSNSNDQGFSL